MRCDQLHINSRGRFCKGNRFHGRKLERALGRSETVSTTLLHQGLKVVRIQPGGFLLPFSQML